jgi:shikimate dehydrogenase
MRITAHTRVFALLGDPVGHSLSPRIQNAALEALGLDGVYVALRTGAESLPGLLRGIAGAGGGGNVTLPHKALAAKSVDQCTPAAQRSGAVNTFWAEEGAVWGDNTDVEGFTEALELLCPEGIEGRRVLLLGGGGAARAALLGLEGSGASEVLLWNRTPDRVLELLSALGPLSIPARGVAKPDPKVDLVVNATSLGLGIDDPLPISLEPLREDTALLDLVYRPEETRWIREGRARGHPALDGGRMLVGQGRAAFRRWWGIEAPEAPFLDTLARIREAAERPSQTGV